MPLLDLKTIPAQLKDFWNKLDRRQKVIFVGGTIGITLLLILSIWLYSQINWGLPVSYTHLTLPTILLV